MRRTRRKGKELTDLLLIRKKLKEDLKMARKQARKGKTLHGNLVNLLKQSAILEDGWQNNPKDEIVA